MQINREVKEYKVGDKVLLSTANLKLQGEKKSKKIYRKIHWSI